MSCPTFSILYQPLACAMIFNGALPLAIPCMLFASVVTLVQLLLIPACHLHKIIVTLLRMAFLRYPDYMVYAQVAVGMSILLGLTVGIFAKVFLPQSCEELGKWDTRVASRWLRINEGTADTLKRGIQCIFLFSVVRVAFWLIDGAIPGGLWLLSGRLLFQ